MSNSRLTNFFIDDDDDDDNFCKREPWRMKTVILRSRQACCQTRLADRRKSCRQQWWPSFHRLSSLRLDISLWSSALQYTRNLHNNHSLLTTYTRTA